jgi:pilus assembly protein Flp/PilA
MERIKNFFSDESGASAVEYGLLVAVLAVGLVAGMTAFRDKIVTSFETAGDKLNTAY